MNKRHYEHTLPNIRGSLSNTYNDHESKGMYRKTENRQMDKKNGTGRRSLHNVQLSLFKRDFTGMGGSRHRLFQGILQVPL